MNKSRWFCKALVAVFVLPILVGGYVSRAQSSQGSLTGTVTDASGAGVPQASVTATETGSNTTYHTLTSSEGAYVIPQARLGTYTLTVTAPNFNTATETGVLVQINTAAVSNIQLTVGAQMSAVTVVADAPTVESTTSDIGAVVSARQVQNLPLSLGGVGAFRSPEAFSFLLPGVVGPGTGNSSNGIYLQKTSGGQNFGDEVLLDGSAATRPDNGSTFDETAPSVDSLQEFRVLTATPPAQYGRTTGGVRSFTTHVGENTVHGSAFDIFRNKVLDANTYFNNLNRGAQCPGPNCSQFGTPKDTKNDYGVTLSGPVVIPHVYNGTDKTFFFFAWEQLRWPQTANATSTIPTSAERTGDFSALLGSAIGTNPCTGATVFAGQIFDPASTTASASGAPCRTVAFTGNQIPLSSFSPVALAVLRYLPQPNLPGLQNNYSQVTGYETDNSTYTIRIDENLSQSDRLFASYSSRENTTLAGGAPLLPAPIDPNTWNQDFVTHYARVGWDHTFSPTILNHVNLGFSRWNSANNTAAVNGTNWPKTLGIANVNGAAFPQFNLGSGLTSIGQPRADDTISNLAEVSDTLSWSVGKHTLSIGGDYRFIQLNNLTQDNDSGFYNFGNAETAAGGGVLSSQGGYGFASFLLGQVDNAALNVFAHYPRYNANYWALYLQDDFKVTPHLTLNLGLRWSVDQPRKEGANFTSNFDPALPNPAAGGRLGALQFASACKGCNVRWAKTFYDDYEPRFGFAWSPGNSGKTAIRGGYAIIYGPQYYADFGNSMNAGYASTPNPVSRDGFAPAFNLNNGFPAYPVAPTLDPSIRNGGSVDYISPGFGKPIMMQSWSFQIQQQLSPDLILSVAYVGDKGQNLRSAGGFGMYNNIRPAALALGQNVLNADIASSVAAAAGVTSPFPGYMGSVGNALRPYPQYTRFNTDCCLENDGMSTYHSLQAMLQRRFRNGLNVQLSYTWSKSLNDADSLQPGGNAGGGVYQDPFNLHLEKAISSQDIPHAFVGSFIYELPFGRGRAFLNQGGFINAVVGGWQIGSILRYQSGQPLPFYCASGVSGWDNCFRFNSVAGQSVFNSAIHQPGFNPLTTPYLNNAYFADPNTDPNAPIQFGQLPRVTGFRMPMFLNEDVTLQKQFNITEKVNVSLRGDAFNLANRHIFAEPYNLGPNPNNPSSNFGYIGGTVDEPRGVQLQMSLRF